MQALLHAPQRAPCGALSRTPVPIVPIFRPVPYAPAATCPFPVPRDLPCSMSKPATFGLLLTVESQPPCPPLHQFRRHDFILMVWPVQILGFWNFADSGSDINMYSLCSMPLSSERSLQTSHGMGAALEIASWRGVFEPLNRTQRFTTFRISTNSHHNITHMHIVYCIYRVCLRNTILSTTQ